jgi:UDP:flavonoid glycosyltransferase YjiC (YdhE family)
MVAAGVNEGKNEICARIDYFKLGTDLRTEKPTPKEIKMAVAKILSDPEYINNVERLRDEFNRYDSSKLAAKYILEVAHN